MSALVIGIDPDLGGALALLTSDGVLVDLDDMPVLSDAAAGRRAINAPPLASLLAYAERESARRAKGVHPGMTRLQDDELAALLAVLWREVGTASVRGEGIER